MERATVRIVVMWVMLLSGGAWLLVSFSSQLALHDLLSRRDPFMSSYVSTDATGPVVLISLGVGAIHMVSMLVFVVMLHRDLTSCERWVSFERSRLASGESAPLASDPGAGAVGGPSQSSDRF